MVSPAGRHAQRREQSIERLRQAAVELLKTQNYAAIRIEDIAARVGLAVEVFRRVGNVFEPVGEIAVTA